MCCLPGEAPTCRQDERCERGVLNLPNSLDIGPLFLHFVLSVGFLNGGVLVGGSVGVEHPNINKSSLKPPSPKTVDRDVQSGPVSGVGQSPTQLLRGHLLKVRLDANIVAHFGQEGGGNVPDLIMAD